MEKVVYSLQEYAKVSRAMAAEGCVLLKNDGNALPVLENSRVAVFGINAFHYYKSGLGSGGLVNAKYVVSVLDALLEEKLTVDKKLLNTYHEWIAKNPFDVGKGWGMVPWSQKEMPLDEDTVSDAAKRNDVAIICIGRTAGEDQDNTADSGSYYLSDEEKRMLSLVCAAFEKTVVLLNTGNIIDMNFVSEYNPSAVMYIWQGGQEGGHGVADVILGRVNPSGKLADTIAKKLSDYPSDVSFGNMDKNYYKEDIYVGYRYFETFLKDAVIYPFGFGLSYTDFTINANIGQQHKDEIAVIAEVTNTGNVCGKEVVQVYINAPCVRLNKPEKVFAGFKKTKLLQPGEKETLEIVCPKSYFASYDESGATGFKNCFVLEEGKYSVYCGNNVRDAVLIGSWMQPEEIVEKLKEECAPNEEFEILNPLKKGAVAATRTRSYADKIAEDVLPEIAYTGNKNILLKDVYYQKAELDDFIAQLSDNDLACLTRGEGLCSKKAVPGVVGAFGGMTASLRKFGIPVISVADGPSGIRLDCGRFAFSNPNGAVVASSFNTELAELLFVYQGIELRNNGIDMLLGPGINIHRHPLNGRNFEYFSEDPLLTGKMCAALLKGLKRAGVDGTIKHFAANNQEKNRNYIDAIVSQRALREIYLRAFEIAVKEGKAKSIMTSYNPFNGLWTSGNYELCTGILRKEWKFDGIVMSDWWAMANWENEAPDVKNRAAMVRAQNDLFMLCDDNEVEEDNILPSLAEGKITRGQLQRNAKNILKFILSSLSMQIELGRLNREELAKENGDLQEFIIPENISVIGCRDEVIINPQADDVEQEYGQFFDVDFEKKGTYKIAVSASSELSELAQLTIAVFIGTEYFDTILIRGTGGKMVERCTDEFRAEKGRCHFKFVYHKYALKMSEIKITKVEGD